MPKDFAEIGHVAFGLNAGVVIELRDDPIDGFLRLRQVCAGPIMCQASCRPYFSTASITSGMIDASRQPGVAK